MRNKKELNASEMKKLKDQLKEVPKLGIKMRGEVIVEALESMTTAEVASATGKSPVYVNQYSSFNYLPQDIQLLIINKEIGLTQTLKILSQFHQLDPKKYQKAKAEIKNVLEQKEKAKEKKAPKAKEVSVSDLRRAFKNINWIIDEINSSSQEKLNIMEKNIMEALDLALGNSKKKEIQDKIRKITSTTAGRK